MGDDVSTGGDVPEACRKWWVESNPSEVGIVEGMERAQSFRGSARNTALH